MIKQKTTWINRLFCSNRPVCVIAIDVRVVSRLRFLLTDVNETSLAQRFIFQNGKYCLKIIIGNTNKQFLFII